MRILIGVDGSENGYRALAQAASLASPQVDELALCYSPPAGTSSILVQAVLDKGTQLMPDAARPRVRTFVGTRSPQEELLAVADEWKADLIAVGARGLGPVQRMLLGSVSAYLARNAKTPVLVARDAKAPFDQTGWNVLVAVESQATGQKLAPILSGLSWPSSAKGRLMSVIEAMLAGEVPDWLEPQARSAETQAMADAWTSEHEADREAKRHELMNLARQLPPALRGEPLVAEGHALDEILAAIDREKVNLVVVGARDKSMWERLVLGTISDAVLTHAPCSVLLVHVHEPSKENRHEAQA
jgi:nucleotide-binding universal stress UspA family protein